MGQGSQLVIYGGMNWQGRELGDTWVLDFR